MNRSRRTFLAGAGAAVSSGLLAPADAAETPKAGTHPPRGLTLATVRTGGALSLAVKTARGLLDVGKAKAALRQHAPPPIDEVLRGE